MVVAVSSTELTEHRSVTRSVYIYLVLKRIERALRLEVIKDHLVAHIPIRLIVTSIKLINLRIHLGIQQLNRSLNTRLNNLIIISLLLLIISTTTIVVSNDSFKIVLNKNTMPESGHLNIWSPGSDGSLN